MLLKREKALYAALLEMDTGDGKPQFRFPVATILRETARGVTERKLNVTIPIPGKAKSPQEGINVLAKLGKTKIAIRVPPLPDGSVLEFRVSPQMTGFHLAVLLAYIGGLDVPEGIPAEEVEFVRSRLIVQEEKPQVQPETSAPPATIPPTESREESLQAATDANAKPPVKKNGKKAETAGV